jgi:hypothetical protein
MNIHFRPPHVESEPIGFNRLFLICVLSQLERDHDESAAGRHGAETWIKAAATLAAACFTGLGVSLLQSSFDQAMSHAQFDLLPQRATERAPISDYLNLLPLGSRDTLAPTDEEREAHHSYLLAVLLGRSNWIGSALGAAQEAHRAFPLLPESCYTLPPEKLASLVQSLKDRSELDADPSILERAPRHRLDACL